MAARTKHLGQDGKLTGWFRRGMGGYEAQLNALQNRGPNQFRFDQGTYQQLMDNAMPGLRSAVDAQGKISSMGLQSNLGQLISGAGRLLVSADRRVEDPRVGALSTTLRRDVHRSSAVHRMVTAWDEGPLELASWDGGRVRFFLEGEALVRETAGGSGAPAGRRIVVNGVSSWWWRMVTPQMVEVRVTVLPRPGLGASSSGVRRNVVLRRFAVRGWPDGRSW